MNDLTHEMSDRAIDRLLTGEALEPFVAWFVHSVESVLTAGRRDPTATGNDRRARIHGARLLWGQFPFPGHGWRPRGLPKTERNAPCHCGSGRKFKHCCADLEHLTPPLEPEALLAMALFKSEPKWLTPQHVRALPAHLLGNVAMLWNQQGQEDKVMAVLLPLFEQHRSVDKRHEMALDALLDAMLTLGQVSQRRELIDRMAQHPDKTLATTARCRLVSMLADQGDEAAAWKLFHETQRFNPIDPQLWHLELSLLLSQGRQEEARLRAPLLAARARQQGLDDLALALVKMAEQGISQFLGGLDDEVDDSEDLEWLALADTVPQAVKAQDCEPLYHVRRVTLQEAGAPVTQLWIEPHKTLLSLNKRWQRKFLVGKPDLTWLEGDVDLLLGSLPEAQAFLQKQPQAWYSAEVLDDLLLAAYALCADGAPRPVIQAARRVAEHALSVLRIVVGDDPHAQLEWAVMEHRPWLRCLAVAVGLCRTAMDEEQALALMQWGLRLNPSDNHGWRAMVAPLLVEKGRPEQALALLDRYPGDMPPSGHVRALALFALARRDEAEVVLRAAHAAHPLYLQALLPEFMDEPPNESGPGIRLGGETSAWYHRLEWRPLWVRSGALAWVRDLALPDPPAPKTKARSTPKRRPKGKIDSPSPLGFATLNAPFGQPQDKRLRKTCTDVPHMHGLLTAVAWSPQMLMPSVWLPLAMSLHDRMPNSRTEATAMKARNDVLQITMQLYNHVNQWVLDHLSDAHASPTQALAHVVTDDETACAWAAGFVRGCETALAAWARVGHKVTGQTGPFGCLRSLAARAAAQGAQARIQQDDGSPLLKSVDARPPATEQLASALLELWPIVVVDRLKPR